MGDFARKMEGRKGEARNASLRPQTIATSGVLGFGVVGLRQGMRFAVTPREQNRQARSRTQAQAWASNASAAILVDDNTKTRQTERQTGDLWVIHRHWQRPHHPTVPASKGGEGGEDS